MTTDDLTTTDSGLAGDDAELDEKGITPAALDDMMAATAKLGAEQRLWVKSIHSIVHRRSRESDPSARVQFELDMLAISACAALRRMLDQVGLAEETD